MIKSRVVIAERNATIYFDLTDLVHPSRKDSFSNREILIPWLLAGNTPDQSTGEHDMECKEVYGGDIVSKVGKDVKGDRIEARFPVCFGPYDNGEDYEDAVCGNGWYLGQEVFLRAGVREKGSWECKCKEFLSLNEYKVIGNIYQNPELLAEETTNEQEG